MKARRARIEGGQARISGVREQEGAVLLTRWVKQWFCEHERAFLLTRWIAGHRRS